MTPPNVTIFDTPLTELLGTTPPPPDGGNVAQLVGNMTKQEFGKELAALISAILFAHEEQEKQDKEDTFVLGGGGTGAGADINAILMG